jgi:hypothetical protein
LSKGGFLAHRNREGVKKPEILRPAIETFSQAGRARRSDMGLRGRSLPSSSGAFLGAFAVVKP